MSAYQEKEYIKQIKFLRDSLKFMKTKQEIFAEIKELRAKKSEVSEGIDELKAETREILGEIESLKKQRDGGKEGEIMSKRKVEEINQEREHLKGNIARARMEKDRIREKYYKDLVNYEKQKKELNTIEFMNRIKNDLMRKEEEKSRKKEYWQEKRRRQEEER